MVTRQPPHTRDPLEIAVSESGCVRLLRLTGELGMPE
jgi:hypothetical protein